jgi:hypothetical protein
MNGEWYNYTKKARNRSKLLSLVRSWSVVSFVEILKSTASHPFQMPGVRLSQCQMLFLRLSRDRFAFGLVRIHCCGCLVGALSLDVTGLLALVASSLGGGLGGAVTGEMSDFAAVVALLALGAVAWKLLEEVK